jgi:Holliday junction resolvase RusA-like endonuclease
MGKFFVKKPIEIEAVQWLGNNREEIENFIGDYLDGFIKPDLSQFMINTLDGKTIASLNDWIIKGIQGEFYPCKPDIFEWSYSPLNKLPKGYSFIGGWEHTLDIVSNGSVRPSTTRSGVSYYSEEYKRFRKLFPILLGQVGWNEFVKYGKVGQYNEYIYEVKIVMKFEMPTSWSNKKREEMKGCYKDTKPDVDNMQKGVLDGMFEQDQLIFKTEVEKVWWEKDETEIFVKQYKFEKQ